MRPTPAGERVPPHADPGVTLSSPGWVCSGRGVLGEQVTRSVGSVHESYLTLRQKLPARQRSIGRSMLVLHYNWHGDEEQLSRSLPSDGPVTPAPAKQSTKTKPASNRQRRITSNGTSSPVHNPYCRSATLLSPCVERAAYCYRRCQNPLSLPRLTRRMGAGDLPTLTPVLRGGETTSRDL